MKLPEPYKTILMRIGTIGIVGFLLVMVLGIVSLVTLFETFDDRAHFIAGIVLMFGLPALAGYGAEALLGYKNEDGDMQHRAELLTAIFLAMMTLICGVLAATWPSGLISENTPFMFGVVAVLLALFCIQMFFGAILAGGFKHLVWRPLDSYPTIKAGLILLFLALMCFGVFLAALDG